MSRIRTFIAIPLETSIRKRAAALQGQLANSGIDVKWTEQKNLHITLIFLGEVEDREIPTVCGIVADVVKEHEPFRATLTGVGCFPTPRRPRVIWLGVQEGGPAVCDIHDHLEDPLTELGYRREVRKYTPHITLGRIRGRSHATGFAESLAQYGNWQAGEMTVKQIHIMGSEFTRNGPMYTVLSRVNLGGTAGS